MSAAEPPEPPRTAPHRTASVVVPTYKRRDGLADVIRPLLDDPATHEVVVVVDGAHDGSFEMLQEWAQTQPKLKPVWQDNAGEGAARAAGLAAATGDIVLFLDDDVVAEPGLVGGHLRAHEAGDDLLVLGYMPPALPEPRLAGHAPTYVYAHDYELVCRAYEKDPQQVLLNLWAGNLSIGREAAERVGVAGSQKLGYHEDKQFGYRCAAAGLKPAFSRSLRATHRHKRTVEQFRAEVRRQANARAVLAAENAEVDADAWLVWRPSGVLGAALNVLSRQPIYGVWTAGALGLMRLAGAARLWTVETTLLRLIRQVDLYRFAQGGK